MIEFYASLNLQYPIRAKEQASDSTNELFAWNARLMLLRHSPSDLEENAVKTWALEHPSDTKQKDE